MQQTAFGSEGASWPGTRQDLAVMGRPRMYEPLPITRPPIPGVHVAAPSAPPGGWQMPNTTSQPGLESLTHLDKIFIDQHVENLEIWTGFHGENKYTIMNSDGQPLFHMREESSFLDRMCFGRSRRFKIKVYDNSAQNVFRLESPMNCCSAEIDVYVGNSFIGHLKQSYCTLSPKVEVECAQGMPLFQIEGPCCGCSCLWSSEYQVFSADRSRQIGVISREWPGIERVLFTNADIFGVSFPRDLNVNHKVLLIGSTFLIDLAFHEGY
ncbi:phospholipid scramblase 1-like isoform X2 [Venturia canescens]|nr:phospholipid scramblase 1-like isoform X2 [Venturia canescens]XP_043284918.1 phospholipid scramblase 1-like isoform X2 [Venturia canescens]XP_043284919.1 phospholipid scramblase 1-like isoform X2 [Venturia canescens]XP_043284921.1 phospholipid scramblase 1-like isoform X2 [Venturia canescens]XP_043284922.1 phospholipid scramblase 1-like isoform X2 [Venturia canescens]XP_043284923.1 phospholipid scramblase 1-like isoform X2 [Venturia canescens]